MSDYVKKKAIRLPFPKDLIEKLKVKNCWDCEDYLDDIYGESYGYSFKDKPYIEIAATDGNYYLDYVLSYDYGMSSGDYGITQYLTEEEVEKYRPLFEKVTTDFKDTDLRKVVYCYYNGSEPPDYYEVKNDIFKIF